MSESVDGMLLERTARDTVPRTVQIRLQSHCFDRVVPVRLVCAATHRLESSGYRCFDSISLPSLLVISGE